ncbi:MAG: NAD/NADP octopine/nopaline dehydrogenase family protein, partial [Acidimicrobiia bacterium]|nr:NAD/NADP octopine/nopaline dehydrogenase family protein [Acidimicrobiia bacterium]
LRCAVLGSLVPLVSAAEVAGVDVPATRAMIDLVTALVGGDLESAGRRLDRIGIAADSLGAVRRAVDQFGFGGS